MDHGLQVVLVLLAVAVMVVVLCRVLHLPVMLGYLTVGILIGPHALGWVADAPQARHLAEFGVVFLMFSIGLEFSLAKLHAMRRIVFGLGSAQVVATLLVAVAAALALGLDWRAGVALGGVLAMSSTAIVSKMLAERAELGAPFGQQIMGVLLFQDLAVVPLLIVIPALASASDALTYTLLFALLKGAAALTALLLFGQRLMRPWFHIVARQKSAELFMLNVLLITLGLAYLTDLAGLSMALGAFVAGVLIAETEYRLQVEEDIRPFRDVLMGLFFITIGMMLNVREMWADLGWVVLLLLSLLLCKAVIVAGLARIFGVGWGVALHTGLGLAQAGEFGFVLLNDAGNVHLMSERVGQVVLAAMLLSMLIAPFLLMYADRIVRRISPDAWMYSAMQMHQIAVRSMSSQGHVIICGFGRSGQTLARFLSGEGIRYIALDADSSRVRNAVAEGGEVVFGDASKREALLAAGLMRAKTLVVSYIDKHSALKILQLAQELRPGLPVVVRAYDESQIDQFRQAGAAEVVAEIHEGSVMLATQALLMSGVPLNRVMRRLRESRARSYRVFDSYLRTTDGELEDVDDDLQLRVHSVLLGAQDDAVGKSLARLDLASLGVEVNAVRRHGVLGSQPSDEMVLHAGDVLVLLGQSLALAEAEQWLRGGDAPPAP
ncbi:monovalent cation:proton antiporter family protein [Ferriphaselus sp. R-1]|uniref:monovalent cation:proton antiporter family protein n=1 Tax=Ferriphaselus sp. R-1 TaxID=1485544 RepID=UPI0005541051|nr:monovalent cation:proton antiporter family protein [Ferriphaselus sp. R-1]